MRDGFSSSATAAASLPAFGEEPKKDDDLFSPPGARAAGAGGAYASIVTVASVYITTSSVSLGSGLTRMHESGGRRTRGRRDAF